MGLETQLGGILVTPYPDISGNLNTFKKFLTSRKRKVKNDTKVYLKECEICPANALDDLSP